MKPLRDSHLDSEHFSGRLLHRVHVVVPLTVSRLKSDLTSSQDKDEGGIDSPIKAGQVTHYPPPPLHRGCFLLISHVSFKHQKLTCWNRGERLRSDPGCCFSSQDEGGAKWGWMGKYNAAVALQARGGGGEKNKVVDSATPSSLLPGRRINI